MVQPQLSLPPSLKTAYSFTDELGQYSSKAWKTVPYLNSLKGKFKVEIQFSSSIWSAPGVPWEGSSGTCWLCSTSFCLLSTSLTTDLVRIERKEDKENSGDAVFSILSLPLYRAKPESQGGLSEASGGGKGHSGIRWGSPVIGRRTPRSRSHGRRVEPFGTNVKRSNISSPPEWSDFT